MVFKIVHIPSGRDCVGATGEVLVFATREAAQNDNAFTGDFAGNYVVVEIYPTVKSRPLGFVVYEGPSMIDGSPIVVIVNKVFDDSKNAKTGAIVQTFIIRSDIDPMDALRTGADAAICGTCEHRPSLVKAGSGKAPCYVNVGRSVQSVYGAYKRGRYAVASPEFVAQFLSDKTLRLGTYGDPAAAPVAVWHALAAGAGKRVGYSHQWAAIGFDVDAWSSLLMASVDTVEQREQANALGMRTFRVSVPGTIPVKGEVSCPASKEAGQKTTCAACKLCGGNSAKAKDIVIQDHAIGFNARRVISIGVAA